MGSAEMGKRKEKVKWRVCEAVTLGYKNYEPSSEALW